MDYVLYGITGVFALLGAVVAFLLLHDFISEWINSYVTWDQLNFVEESLHKKIQSEDDKMKNSIKNLEKECDRLRIKTSNLDSRLFYIDRFISGVKEIPTVKKAIEKFEDFD